MDHLTTTAAGPVGAAAELNGQRPEELPRAARVLKRVLVVGAGVAVFALVASVVDPRISPGQNRPMLPVLPIGESPDDTAIAETREQVQRGLLERIHPRGWRVLGLIEGVEYYVLIHGSPEGPRYTVCTLAGRVLQADLPADDVYRAFPTVDVEGMRLEPAKLGTEGEGSQLMLADPVVVGAGGGGGD